MNADSVCTSSCGSHPVSVREWPGRAPCFLALFFICSAVAVAQTQASCSFTTFPLSVPNATGTTGLLSSGINDFRTIVGYAQFSDTFGDLVSTTGFIRWASGGITYLDGTPNQLLLVDRNDKGINVGYIGSEGNPMIFDGKTAKPITLKIGASEYSQFFVTGINDWGSIVGFYESPGGRHGFKRWSNGSGFSLDYPGASLTEPAAINDNGTIVGHYVGAQLSVHGFIYHNGQWATLDFPNSSSTDLQGISNAGVIVGTTYLNGATTSTTFLYKNGGFETIALPDQGAQASTVAFGTSLRSGLIVGMASSSTMIPPQGFIADCK
jgi:hypothetical protein